MINEKINDEEVKYYDVVIVGSGLAGLSTAALLSKKGKKVVLLEKGKIGGRAITVDIKGFSFNFGAHAIYARDKSYLSVLEKELELHINWKDYSAKKAKYDLGNEMSDMPANIQGLLNTKLLKNGGKVQFAWSVLRTMISLEKGQKDVSIKKWLDDNNIRTDVKEMFLTLASSNFFTKEPDKIPSDVFFEYYKRVFKTNKPVSYIEGGWKVLIEELEKVIKSNGGEILEKSGVTRVITKEDKVEEIITSKSGNFKAKDFIFCVPPSELIKIFGETEIETQINKYANYQPSYVMFYDIGLKTKIESSYTYVYDKENNIFVTDISYYDKNCVPEGGQLLQAIAYLKDDEVGNPEVFENYKEKIEKFYDKHFAGWREELVVPRISKKAIVQEIKWTMEQEAMPIHFSEFENLFFAGDWCKGQGQLSELSFSTAYEASSLILEKQK